MLRFPRVVATALVTATIALPVCADEPPAVDAQVPPPNHPRVCLVLSGGGARGVAHVGVLKVLEDLRVPVHCIVGTSMGAIIGGAYAYGMTPAELERQIRETQWDSVLMDQPLRGAGSVTDTSSRWPFSVTPSCSAVSTSTGFFFAFMMSGSFA